MAIGVYIRPTPIERILKKVDIIEGSECIYWTGPSWHGYGYIGVMYKKKLVHRIVYEYCVGPIPDGFEIDHECRTRNCVNSNHLRTVTHLDNVLYSPNAQKTHCKRGHEFTIENTIQLRPNKFGKSNGRRSCKACMRKHHQATRKPRDRNKGYAMAN